MGFAPGRLFHVITAGSGKMPSYAPELSVDERWKVVTYVRASLQGVPEVGTP
jgi:mono/diheme cytochrome c family protein